MFFEHANFQPRAFKAQQNYFRQNGTYLQAGAPVYHPLACKSITPESLWVLHSPVYRKTGGFYW